MPKGKYTRKSKPLGRRPLPKNRPCPDCGENDVDKFYCKVNGTSRSLYCKGCVSDRAKKRYQLADVKERKKHYSRQWHANNPIPLEVRSDRYYRQKYGFGVDEARRKFALANHQCQICGKMGNLHLDHDHNTGEHRGILCGDCNRGLGLFHDNPEWLREAAKYLES